MYLDLAMTISFIVHSKSFDFSFFKTKYLDLVWIESIPISFHVQYIQISPFFFNFSEAIAVNHPSSWTENFSRRCFYGVGAIENKKILYNLIFWRTLDKVLFMQLLGEASFILMSFSWINF